ncbi:LOW QUALITY PROTEIN: hypothetical protein QYF61_000528 [Mycteria americana]|uniref:Uncharacterized protein n=1 Tax=Mycteria americana TaxID=33587 RepID=A0AAN7NMH6_MYCAM|nr:LOW QUALITY PROTEIN: hypothetical protein QYF61_000528 [Mycteria americana]
MGLFLSRCRTLHFSFLNFMRFVSAHFSSLLRSVSMAAQPSGVSANPPRFVSPENFLRSHAAPPPRSLMKMLNRTGPNIDPWGALLVNGLQLDFIPLITTFWTQPFSQFSVHLTVCLPSPSTASLEDSQRQPGLCEQGQNKRLRGVVISLYSVLMTSGLLNPVLGPPIQDRLKNWREFRGSHRDGGAGKSGGPGFVQSGVEMALGGPNSSPLCIWGMGQGGRLIDNGYKVKQESVRLDLRRHFFPVRTVRQWHGLPREVVQSPSSEVFKPQLDEAQSSLTPRSVKKEGEEVFQALEQRFPAACGEDHDYLEAPETEEVRKRGMLIEEDRKVFLFYRIIESFRLEKTFKIIESNRKPNTTKTTTTPCP